jgi:oligopeptidase B
MPNDTIPFPPQARRTPQTTNHHGFELRDDFAWLREKDSPETLAYLHAENAWTAQAMAGTEALQGQLYDEILSHIKEDDESVPYEDDGWIYWSRTLKGAQYPVYLRRRADLSLPEEVLLDVNRLAEGQPFMAVGDLALSPDKQLLAYTTDNTGFRQYTLHLLVLATRELLPFTVERVGSLAWAADARTLLFTTEDEQTKRQDQLFRADVYANAAPVLVFHEPDERFNLGVGRTRDRKYILLSAGSHTTSESRFLSTATPDAEFTLIAPRIDDEEYDVDHREGFFYIHTNHVAEHFRLVRAPVATPGREHWQELLAEVPNTPLDDVDLFQGFLVTTYRERGLPILRVFALDADGAPTTPHDIRFPDAAYSASGSTNATFNTTTYRYAYQSLARPASVFAYDVAANSSTLLKQQEVPGDFDAARYAVERVWFQAHDGAEVPVSLVYRHDLVKHDGTAPLYVYGYGSYGYPLPLGFSASRLPLLDRGVVVAYAHIRGGGELGDPWHDAGKMMLKRNTFSDFVEAIDFLVAEKYGDPKRVAVEGGSAGGLLMGAVLNLRPELFRVMLSHVPFVDVMNTMLDATLPLTVAEYEEWGNPNEPAAFEYMRSYSPYDNLEALQGHSLPALLVKTSLNDSQVMYWEPAKYVAKLRSLKSDDAPLLLHINMDAGHGGASGRYDYLKEIAFDHAFLLRELGVVK